MTGPGDCHPPEQHAQTPEPSVVLSKSKPQTLREFERALRDVGYSRGEAAAIAKGGFKAVQAGDVSEQLEDLAADLRRFAETFK